MQENLRGILFTHTVQTSESTQLQSTSGTDLVCKLFVYGPLAPPLRQGRNIAGLVQKDETCNVDGQSKLPIFMCLLDAVCAHATRFAGMTDVSTRSDSHPTRRSVPVFKRRGQFSK